MIILCHFHMPLYFLGTFTEYLLFYSRLVYEENQAVKFVPAFLSPCVNKLFELALFTYLRANKSI